MSLEKPDPKCEAITYSEGSVLWSFGVIIMKNECLVFQNMQISLIVGNRVEQLISHESAWSTLILRKIRFTT